MAETELREPMLEGQDNEGADYAAVVDEEPPPPCPEDKKKKKKKNSWSDVNWWMIISVALCICVVGLLIAVICLGVDNNWGTNQGRRRRNNNWNNNNNCNNIDCNNSNNWNNWCCDNYYYGYGWEAWWLVFIFFICFCWIIIMVSWTPDWSTYPVYRRVEVPVYRERLVYRERPAPAGEYYVPQGAL